MGRLRDFGVWTQCKFHYPPAANTEIKDKHKTYYYAQSILRVLFKFVLSVSSGYICSSEDLFTATFLYTSLV